MRNEAIGYNLMATHVREKIDMLDAFIDLLERIEDHRVDPYEFGIDAASRELGVRSFAGYLACELEELRMGKGLPAGPASTLPDDVMPIAMHFESQMAMDHMRDNPRS